MADSFPTQEENPFVVENSFSFKKILSLFGIALFGLILGAASVVGYFYFVEDINIIATLENKYLSGETTTDNKDANIDDVTSVEVSDTEQDDLETSGEDLTTYFNEIARYTLKYPSNWNLDESEAVNCEEEVEDGGCLPIPAGLTVTINKPGSENKLQIGGDGSTVSYAFDRDKNYKEEEITFWDQLNKKGLVYCRQDPINCVEDEYNNLLMTFYHDGLDSNATNACSNCFYPEGNLKYTCSVEDESSKSSMTVTLDIIGRFYDEYNEEEDQIFDEIVQSITEPDFC